ncbi:hypothetical protein [Neorickettsia sp. 179522]|uniref:hypothetical protein n=1 Tax=Neorickettsia sp. 179522 TaxID=1714371 RepID=UPI00079A1A55|nr:hypothetical protein [Neorickettsia sp. 179522]KYH12659.1 hypothetical protein AS219_02645 [Neorickettsia sp. 179522]
MPKPKPKYPKLLEFVPPQYRGIFESSSDSDEGKNQAKGGSDVTEGKSGTHGENGAAKQQGLGDPSLVFLQKLRRAVSPQSPFGPFPQSREPIGPSDGGTPGTQLEGEIKCTDHCENRGRDTSQSQ